MNILVIDRPGSWHVQELKRAADRHVSVDTVSYHDLHVRFANSDPHNIRESGFCARETSMQHYDCVVTRAMPAATLEQVVFRMDWLGQLAVQNGKFVVNPARALEASIDKYLSLEKMRAAGVPVPACHVSQTADQALAFFISNDCDSVVKPIFGSRGRSLVRVRSEPQAISLFQSLAGEGRVIYQQRFIDHGDEDIRLLVIGEQVFGLRRHRPGHWITNMSCGATGYRHVPSSAEREIATLAARSVHAVVAGVDLVYERRDRNRPFVVEINACPSWRALQHAWDEDIAQHVLSLLERNSHPDSAIERRLA